MLTAPAQSPARHRHHPVSVTEVVRETADAVSMVLEPPASVAELFSYTAGQYVTLRVELDGQTHYRSYSMSSAPGVDAGLRITVKRTEGGVVSSWLTTAVTPGDVLELSPPAGTFVADDGAGDVVAFAAGSGITPVLSLIKHVLATTGRRIRLLYANRDRPSTIFAAELDRLAGEHGDRLVLRHRDDITHGLLDSGAVLDFVGDVGNAHFYVCGPGPFMDVVTTTLRVMGLGNKRITIERFTPDETPAPVTAAPGVEVTIRSGGRAVTTVAPRGSTLLQAARSAGIRAPASCESGSCATCMGRVLSGTVAMRTNDALTSDEVAAGWTLTCQAEPTSSAVEFDYEEC